MSKPLPRNNPIILSLTGGIGAGKSVVAKFFSILGIPVYDADSAAKDILAKDRKVVSAVRDIFGDQAYSNREPNRAYLAKRIFEDPELRKALNKIVHPAVASDFSRWMTVHIDAPYVVKEAAIAIETGAYKISDFIVLVTAPKPLRIARVMKRNQISAAEVEKRMDAQWTDAEKMPFADFTIFNDGHQAIIPQTLHIHHTIIRQAVHENPNFEKNLE